MASLTISYENTRSIPETGITLDSNNALLRLTQQLPQNAAAILLTDEIVWKHYEPEWREIRQRFSDVVIIPSGESSKNISIIGSVAERCASAHLDRDSILVAFGGGVVTDIGGFIASIFLRGINWIAIPTTIIGAVDAAIGGKTGINLPNGKNLVGTFYPAQSVIVDNSFFASLPNRELISGWGEIVKYGLLIGGILWNRLHEIQPDSIPGMEILEPCIRKKVELVEKDLYDHGERRLLNLGHTAGHALEAATSFDAFRHGEAILWGLGVSAELSHRLNLLPDNDYKDIEQILRKFDVPKASVSLDSIFSYLSTDKKRGHGMNRWIILNAIGSAEVVENIPSELIRTVLENRTSFLQTGKVVE